ncbi:hypothetical protein HWV62_40800 [Athelia sp. TMB]|nr:hypothetical protein HWV62_40800 [Athelia sp. TMB]
MPTLDAGEVGGPNHEGSDAHSLWEVDLAKLGLTNTEFDTIKEDLRGPIVQECLEIHRFPRDLQNNPFNKPNYLITSKKAKIRLWVLEERLPNLCQLLANVYDTQESFLLTASSSSGPAGTTMSETRRAVIDDLITSVSEVRYDVLDDGTAAYWVEWKILPEMDRGTLESEWVREKDMPKRWVQAHEFRRTSDVWEYGPVEIPFAAHDPDSPPSLTTISYHPPAPKSPIHSMDTVPPASQPFPMSPPNLRTYSLPPDPQFSDLELNDDSSDEDLPASLSAAVAKMKSSQNQPSNSTGGAQELRRSDDRRPAKPLSLPARKRPSNVVKEEIPSPPRPTIEPSRSSQKQTQKKRANSPSVSTNDALCATPAPPHRALAAPLNPSSKSKGKRKADLVPSPPAKRTKSRHPHPVKHDDFWYLDGNIIIQVDNTRFRLHRSRLALQSEYFAELFDRKDGDIDPGPEIVDGHPLYVVSGVSADDFATMLRALDNAITYHFEPPGYSDVASILRVATTFSFTNFRTWAVRHLESIWSEDLENLSADRIPNAIETVRLGREYDTPGALKRALYELLRTGGLGHSDVAQNHDGSRPVAVSPADTARLIHAREKLSEAWMHTVTSATREFSCPNAPSAGTATTVACASPASKSASWSKFVYESGLLQDYMYDVLSGLKILLDHDWKGQDGFCDDCVQMRRDAWQKQRVKLWDTLDIYLAIPVE